MADVDVISVLGEAWTQLSPYADWVCANWLTIVLTGEIIGAVLAVKVCAYRRGIAWLAAAVVTIWAGTFR